jgi:chaperonin GroES
MEQSANIASQLDEAEAKQIALDVFQGYTVDDDSRQDWLKLHEGYLKLYHQQDNQVESVFPEMAEISIPLLTEAVNGFQARAYKAFFPQRQFLNAVPENTASEQAMDVAERVGKHMNWQLTIRDRMYRPNKNDMFQAVAIHGSDFSKVYYDPYHDKNIVERVRAEDLVIPYGYGSRELKDIERKTHVIYMSMNEAKKRYLAEYFIVEPSAMPLSEQTSNVLKNIQDKAEGLDTPSESLKVCQILEQHTFYDLDDDGIAEPYVITIDATSRKLLRMVPRYEIDESGNPIDEEGQPLKPEDIIPQEYFVHYGCLPNPDGFYRYGYGHILAKLNRSCNAMLRQIVEAGGLANVGNMGGFMSDKLGIEGDEFEAQIGKFTKVPVTADDIRKHIYQMQFPGPNAALYNALQYVESIARRVGSTTDPVMGNVDKVMQPMTIMTLLDSALQMPTSIMETMALSFEQELEMLYKLNRKHINKKEYFYDGTNSSYVTPEDYKNVFRIVPILDPRSITKQQKVAKAQETYTFVMNNPDLNQNPQVRHEAATRVFHAMEVEDIDKINPKLPEPPKPQNIQDQQLENMYFLLPEKERPLFDVFPDQDHVEHIKDTDEMITLLTQKYLEGETLVASVDPAVDSAIKTMANEIKISIVQQLQLHKTKHLAFMYGQATGVIDGQGKPVSMATSAGNPMDASGISQGLQSGAGASIMPDGQGGIPQGAGGGAIPPEQMAPQDPGLLGLGKLDFNQQG